MYRPEVWMFLVVSDFTYASYNAQWPISSEHFHQVQSVPEIKLGNISIPFHNAQWASCQIKKSVGCACAGNAGNSFPRQRLQRKPLVIDPGMHHGTCVTRVPWCMSGSITCGVGKNVPDITGACATRVFTYLIRGSYNQCGFQCSTFSDIATWCCSITQLQHLLLIGFKHLIVYPIVIAMIWLI